MPKINNVNISDAEFTAMQERGTAFILMRAFKDNKKFNKIEDIIKDKVTKEGIEDIFKYQSKKLFNLKFPLPKKSPEERWITTFFLQHEKILDEFSNAKFTVFNRDGGFMQFISDLIKDKFNIAKKDAWNPADIWLIKEKDKFRKVIEKELEGNKATQTIRELNNIMRDMYKRRQVIGLSLKLISGQQARYEEVNITEQDFKKYETKEGDYDYNLGRIVMKFSLKSPGVFSTQDTNIFLLNKDRKEIAKFQIKGNTTSSLANLKVEGTEIGASAARLGKAPLPLVALLTKNYKKTFENTNSKFPTNLKEFDKVKMKYADMFETVSKEKNVITEVKDKKEFLKNIEKAFTNKQPWIANSKLMQLNFVNMLLSLKEKERDEYITDLLFLAQKKGRTVFDFGPFGKLY